MQCHIGAGITAFLGCRPRSAKEKYVSGLLSWNKLRSLTKRRLVTPASVGESLLDLLKTLAKQRAAQ